MSNQSNTELLERANELLEDITNHPSGYDKLLQKAIDDNDLVGIRYLTTFIEGELSKDHFYSRGVF